jgi:dolichol-phosphate mannosyltransferase
MGGFFAVRRDRIDLVRLRPQGFKVLLEILPRSSRLRIREVRFEFQQRHSGESKASLAEGLLRKVGITRRGGVGNGRISRKGTDS